VCKRIDYILQGTAWLVAMFILSLSCRPVVISLWPAISNASTNARYTSFLSLPTSLKLEHIHTRTHRDTWLWIFRVCLLSIMISEPMQSKLFHDPQSACTSFFLLHAPRKGIHTYEILYSPVHLPPRSDERGTAPLLRRKYFTRALLLRVATSQ